MEEASEDYYEKSAKINRVFTPSTPIRTLDFFSGRSEQIEQSREAVFEEGKHIIIYGDRGVGKTSLANIIKILFGGNKEMGFKNIIPCYKVSCDPIETFGDTWKKIFKEIKIDYKKNKIGFLGESEEISISLNNCLSDSSRITPSEILDILSLFDTNNKIFIFDEFDTIKDDEIKQCFSYLIKNISDNYPNITVIIVGIGSNINNLINNHQSLERCLKQILVPRMTNKEMDDIITNGLNYIGLKIDDKIKEKIIHFSEGFPHYVHSLSKHTAISAISNKRTQIEEDDFHQSVNDAIEETQESIRESYQKAVSTNRETLFREVLFACALVETDERGTFKASDLLEIIKKVISTNMATTNITTSKYSYHLEKLSSDDRGNVLIKTIYHKGSVRYHFQNPLLKIYVKLKAYELEII